MCSKCEALYIPKNGRRLRGEGCRNPAAPHTFPARGWFRHVFRDAGSGLRKHVNAFEFHVCLSQYVPEAEPEPAPKPPAHELAPVPAVELWEPKTLSRMRPMPGTWNQASMQASDPEPAPEPAPKPQGWRPHRRRNRRPPKKGLTASVFGKNSLLGFYLDPNGSFQKSGALI